MRTISRLGVCAVVLGGVALVAACGSDSGSEGGLAGDGGSSGSSSAGKGGASAGTGGAAAGTGGAAAGAGGAAAGTGGAAAGTGGAAAGSAGQAGSAGKGGATGGSGGAAGGASGAAGAAAGTGGGAGTGTGGTAGKGGAAGAAGKGGSAGAAGKGGSAGTGTGGSAGGTAGSAGTGTGGSAGTGTGGSGGAPSCVGVFQGGVCATCLEGSCCAEVSACDADVDGICLDCVTGASNDPACGTNAPAQALVACVKASCSNECLPQSTCNPVTNDGCTGGQACDLDANGVFSCFDPPNDVALCGGCTNDNGPFCAPTTHCVGAQCTRICKTDGDCMGQGVCDTALAVEGFGFCVVTAGAGDQAVAPCGG